jgi:hypothetical protein
MPKASGGLVLPERGAEIWLPRRISASCMAPRRFSEATFAGADAGRAYDVSEELSAPLLSADAASGERH